MYFIVCFFVWLSALDMMGEKLIQKTYDQVQYFRVLCDHGVNFDSQFYNSK